MKKWLPGMLLLCSATLTFAQQRPQYTQYIFNSYLLNPAITGIENYIDVKAGYRNQWSGLDGAPVTSYISIHAPLGKNFLWSSANSFGGQGDNPMNRSYVQNYAASEPHHGIGFHAVVDKAGPIRRTDVNGTYAYHIGVSNTVNVSLGVSAGFSRISLDLDKISLENAVDPAIVEDENNRVKPDMGAGIYVYGARYFVGLSAQQLLSRRINFTNDDTYTQGKQVPHFFGTAGYKFFLNEDIAAIPSVMVKYVSPAPTSVDVNMKVAFRDKFWLGGSYRKNDSFSALAGFNISYLFNLSYSYDFTTSDLRTVSNGSHEFVLGILLNNRYKVTCPQKTF
ncbi:PorP/SprF family type IX secretion system membrane protein [Hufsiella ginkgonis]|uniref:Type IX secretion system membrane protein PorP/SprF n=1 Tax=Hufsiella ginkgonis TaxID=2695274 RepID=A0A7K1XYN2_9SPHI|nr:type IX secretion system membrane protein PorP/SprF [Hufsiella ginkgonis]MXV15938.1 type IX secretion system membrane protein PorP/SprF [Hufsiella ginkgonis]